MKKYNLQELLQLSLQGHKKSQATLKQLLKKQPSKVEVLLANARVEIYLHNFKSAKNILKKVKQFSLKNSFYLKEYELLLSVMSDDEESFLSQWKSTKGMNLEWKLKCLKMLSQECLKSNEQKLLPIIFDLLESFDADDKQMFIMKGVWLANQGKIYEAREYIKKVFPLEELDDNTKINALILGQQVQYKKTKDELLSLIDKTLKEKKGSYQFLIALASLVGKFNQFEKYLELLDLISEMYKSKENNILHTKIDIWQQIGEWDNVAKYLPKYLKLVRDGEVLPHSIFRHLALPGIGDKEHYMLAKAYCKRFVFPKDNYKFTRKPMSGRKLRVGFMSADFKQHPVTQLLVEVMERYDKNRFEFIAYDNSFKGENYWRKRILASFDRVVHIRELTDGELMKQIRGDELDILVDLQGATTDSRFMVLKNRLAPIHIAWLGFLGTLGGNFNDYILADKYTIPEDSKQYFTEKVIWMPDFHFPADTQRTASKAPPKLLENLPEDKVIYCSFNAQYKINPDTFEVWMNILKNVPNSVLWLVDLKDDTTKRLKDHCKSYGVDLDRLIFAKKAPHNDHLARLQLADVALDTWPYNSGATAIDTLWAGVPLVTFAGNSMMSRVGSGIVNTLGLSELSRKDAKDYEKYAIELGKNKELRETLKQKLLEAKSTSALYNPERFIRHFEKALHLVYDRYEKGLEADHIVVEPIDETSLNDKKADEKYDVSVDVILEKADFLLIKENYKEALELYEQVLNIQDDDHRAIYGKGMCKGLLGDYKESLALLEKAVSLKPEYKKYSLHLEIMSQKASNNWQNKLAKILQDGINYHQNNDFENAKKCYEEVLEVSKKHPATLHYYGLLKVQNKDETGLEMMKEALKLQPNNQMFLTNYKAAQQILQNNK